MVCDNIVWSQRRTITQERARILHVCNIVSVAEATVAAIFLGGICASRFNGSASLPPSWLDSAAFDRGSTGSCSTPAAISTRHGRRSRQTMHNTEGDLW